MMALQLLLLLIFFVVSAAQRGREDQAAEDVWYNQHESCNGTRQSPINIRCRHIESDNELKPLVFENYDKAVVSMLLENNGHTVKATLPPNVPIRLRSDSLPAPYRLSQLHFHWGGRNTGRTGSEHTINGKRWPLELHLVHVNENLAPDDASGHKEDLVVVAVLYDTTGDQPIDGIGVLAEAARKLEDEGTANTLNNFNIGRLLPEDTHSYLRYSGSLTTPPCSEVVEWIILTKTMTVTPFQLRRFRSIRGEEGNRIKENTRGLQPLNDRPIHLFGELGDDMPACRDKNAKDDDQ